MKLKPIDENTDLALRDADARPPKGAPKDDALKEALEKVTDRIGDLQATLYADARYAVLIVFQGRDAAGKDGAIRRVFDAVNPQGCLVTSFGVPSAEEMRHDYLWRIHPHVPARGLIGIFNRSHYEDVIVPRVHKTLPRATIERRYGQINDFERMLVENGTVVLKFFLHVSRAEQKKRLQERLSNPKKNWKFSAGDLDDRALWDEMGDFDPRGVNERLVREVRAALDGEGFDAVKIVVSGGFAVDKIRAFELAGVPADVYGVGSSLLRGSNDFTADIVRTDGRPAAKVGRTERPSPRLALVT